ncbi:MAG: family 20 glycosylhydrolase, partial [Chloroflexota bacterium]|nr:family 20 glycosylhydrolase [Chloroflexota bacterium]
DQIEILGSDEQGMFYGVQTLRQLIRHSTDRYLPCMHILDWPDFAIRGVMLDISRDKVYKMETLFMLVDELSSWKINQLQLYMEHTFAYLGHKTVWHGASPMTPEDILKLDRYCSDRCIELVPNQNSLGHMSRWLKHPTYQHLAETTETLLTPWGHEQKVPFSLAPTQPETLDFVIGLYDQLLPNFSSKQINVGCDETFDLGAGKSKSAVETKGKGQVYLDYLLALHAALNKRGTRMQFWGDIILEYPELIPQLPEDVTALDWGYEGDHPFNLQTYLRKHPDRISTAHEEGGGRKVAPVLDPSLPENQKWWRDGLEWMFETFQIGGINYEMGDFIVNPSDRAVQARAALKIECDENIQEIVVATRDLFKVGFSLRPETILINSTYRGLEQVTDFPKMPYIDVLPSQTVWEYNLRGTVRKPDFAQRYQGAPKHRTYGYLHWFNSSTKTMDKDYVAEIARVFPGAHKLGFEFIGTYGEVSAVNNSLADRNYRAQVAWARNPGLQRAEFDNRLHLPLPCGSLPGRSHDGPGHTGQRRIERLRSERRLPV